ncbi:hypothetical protein QNM99_00155 [Pseudomonas sp. PCH446]
MASACSRRCARASRPGDHAHRRERVEDRIRGLREGADDYLGKPFSFLELVARLQALTRRSGAAMSRCRSASPTSGST